MRLGRAKHSVNSRQQLQDVAFPPHQRKRAKQVWGLGSPWGRLGFDGILRPRPHTANSMQVADLEVGAEASLG